MNKLHICESKIKKTKCVNYLINNNQYDRYELKPLLYCFTLLFLCLCLNCVIWKATNI